MMQFAGNRNYWDRQNDRGDTIACDESFECFSGTGLPQAGELLLAGPGTVRAQLSVVHAWHRTYTFAIVSPQ